MLPHRTGEFPGQSLSPPPEQGFPQDRNGAPPPLEAVPAQGRDCLLRLAVPQGQRVSAQTSCSLRITQSSPSD